MPCINNTDERDAADWALGHRSNGSDSTKFAEPTTFNVVERALL